MVHSGISSSRSESPGTKGHRDSTRAYRRHVEAEISVLARTCSIAVLILLPFLTLIDFFVLDVGVEAVYWRAVCFIPAAALFIILYSPLREYQYAVNYGYRILLVSALVMVFGLSSLTIDRPAYVIFITGSLAVIFLVFALHRGSVLELVVMYAATSAPLLVYSAFFSPIDPIDRLNLINFLMFMSFMVVLYRHFDRIRRERFNDSTIIERQTSELREKNRIISARSEMILREMKLARTIQRDIIPSANPESEKYRVASLYLSMDEIGGDYYDYIDFLERDYLGIFISDVSGHGIPAALITSMIKILINTSGINKLSPGNMLAYINNGLVGNIGSNFVTAFYAILDTDNNRLTYARGGHPFPLLVRGNEITEIKSSGIYMGTAQNQIFHEADVTLQPGDKVIFYTDGLLEAANANGVMFQQEALPAVLKAHAALPIDGYFDAIMKALVDFRGGTIFDDDICMIGLELK